MRLPLNDLIKIPNLISLFRVALMPFFVWFFYENRFALTLAVLLLIIASDFLDGFSSRKLNQVTEMGKVLDPLADKICLGIGLFVIFIKAGVFLWPVYVLIGRDVLIVAAGILIARKRETLPMSNLYGKLSTFFLSVSGLVFFILPFYPSSPLAYTGYGFYWAATAFILISSASYFYRGYRMLKGLE